MVAENPKPVSPRKLAANRRNARKSTGPKSSAGKARSSQNAITHGIFCRAAVLNGESHTEFALLRNSFLESLKPQNILELSIVDRIVLAHWKLIRAQEAEMQQHTFLADQLNKQAKKTLNRMRSKYEVHTAEDLAKLRTDPTNLEDEVALERFKGMIAASELNETPASTTLAISFNATPNHPHAGIVRMSLYDQRLEGSIHRNLRQLKILRGNSDPRGWSELPDSPFLQQIKPPLEDEDIDILQAVREMQLDAGSEQSEEADRLSPPPLKLQNEPTAEEDDATDGGEEGCASTPSPRSRGEGGGEGQGAPESPQSPDSNTPDPSP